jgi:hypothetical protein
MDFKCGELKEHKVAAKSAQNIEYNKLMVACSRGLGIFLMLHLFLGLPFFRNT